MYGQTTREQLVPQPPILLVSTAAHQPACGAQWLSEEGFTVDAVNEADVAESSALTTWAAIVLQVARIEASTVELCRRLSSGVDAPPLLVWAYDAAPPKRVAVLDAGAAGVITGDDAAAELGARVRALVRRRRRCVGHQ